MAPSRKDHKLTPHQIRRWALAAGLLISAAAARAVLFRAPPNVAAYLKNIATAADATPTHFGSWVSTDCPVPPAAITMLRPNATISRRYTNLQTGQNATLLLVQCGDARDLMGHFPPVCYKAHGYNLIVSSAKDLTIDGMTIQGMLYTFSSTQPEELNSMVIFDFMILPDGRTCRDMAGVEATARDPRKRHLGAAQLQILVDPSMPQAQRDALFVALVEVNRPTINAILAGVP